MTKTITQRIESLERRLMPPKEPTKAVTFGARLRDLRQTANLSQRELIKGVGISCAYLSQLENDHSAPGAEVLHRLAQKLSVSMDYLWTGE